MTEEARNGENQQTTSQAECLAFVKFARYAALTADRLAGALLQMTMKLEDEGILKPGRPSRLERDKKIRAYGIQVQKTDDEIAEMMKLIPNHPDSEKLIQTLFRDMKTISINPPSIESLQNLQNVPNPEPLNIPIISENIEIPKSANIVGDSSVFPETIGQDSSQLQNNPIMNINHPNEAGNISIEQPNLDENQNILNQENAQNVSQTDQNIHNQLQATEQPH
ncbi:hypothetical protein TRFO_32589 [Tritrichomonas foetus]|uniref:Uncharacterized protein n=1 Tax=Tritrichomonas foetus TaxID=1144522 RepID=A0A1J4JT52_9EUKA|nr:hypothetical protein TRFO_32589 [Tritrichomonas foetus]|eukprot:OHT00676.1 hypothetical protein TRFO_32589 [Tritrichomonas foetus]